MEPNKDCWWQQPSTVCINTLWERTGCVWRRGHTDVGQHFPGTNILVLAPGEEHNTIQHKCRSEVKKWEWNVWGDQDLWPLSILMQPHCRFQMLFQVFCISNDYILTSTGRLMQFSQARIWIFAVEVRMGELHGSLGLRKVWWYIHEFPTPGSSFPVTNTLRRHIIIPKGKILLWIE